MTLCFIMFGAIIYACQLTDCGNFTDILLMYALELENVCTLLVACLHLPVLLCGQMISYFAILSAHISLHCGLDVMGRIRYLYEATVREFIMFLPCWIIEILFLPKFFLVLFDGHLQSPFKHIVLCIRILISL